MDQTQDREIVIHLKGVLEIFNDIMRPHLKHLKMLLIGSLGSVNGLWLAVETDVLMPQETIRHQGGVSMR